MILDAKRIVRAHMLNIFFKIKFYKSFISYLRSIEMNVMEGAYIEYDELGPFQFVQAWQL